jgi:ParB family transcriptional regulator, chromosome partitioning protein
MGSLFDEWAQSNDAPEGSPARSLIHHLGEFKPVIERPPAERVWRALLGLQRLIAEFNFTHEQAAEAVGKSRSAVSNLLRLLELAVPVQDRVMAGTLEMGHARALAPLAKDKQVMLAEKIAINGLSVRATEALVKDEIGAGTKKRPGVPTARSKQEKLALRDPDLDRLETELADSLGTYVEITHQANGQGELVIRYASLDQLDGLIARMKR